MLLGKPQDWWLSPLLTTLADQHLFWGALTLTALVDNAALTFMGTTVADLTLSAKCSLVAGAVAGGGLTVIANAPNPVGAGLLQSAFGKTGISPARLFLAALPYTGLAALAFLI